MTESALIVSVFVVWVWSFCSERSFVMRFNEYMHNSSSQHTQLPFSPHTTPLLNTHNSPHHIKHKNKHPKSTSISLNNRPTVPPPPESVLQKEARASADDSRTRGGTGTPRRTDGPRLRLTHATHPYAPSPQSPCARCSCTSPRSADPPSRTRRSARGSPRSGGDDAP